MECTLGIGEAEHAEYRAAKWEEQRPHTVQVEVPGVDEPVSVLADVGASLQDLWSLVGTLKGAEDGPAEQCVWVDANPDSLFFHPGTGLGGSSLVDLPFVQGVRLVSDEVREALVWASVVTALHASQEAVGARRQQEKEAEERKAAAATAAAEAEADAEAEVKEEIVSEPEPEPELLAVPAVHRHVETLFPSRFSGDVPEKVASLAIIGGNATPAKMLILDHLLHKFDTLMLVGEMAVPFMGLLGHVVLPKYQGLIQSLGKASKALVAKAQMRGVQLVLPVDAVVSEEALPEGLAATTGTKFDPEARDEGAEFEGDTTTLSLLPPAPAEEGEAAEGEAGGEEGEGEEKAEAPSVETGPTVVNGYIYDIGVNTCKTMASEISHADFVFVWGVPGVCEVGAFQAGQRALVEAVNAIAPADAAAAPAEGEGEGEEKADGDEAAPEPEDASSAVNKPVTVLVGSSTVEWTCRMLDADGELGGDLVVAGAVSYACRRAASMCGLLAGVPSPLLSSGLMQRDPEEGEWTYQIKQEPSEDEDEE